MTRLPEKYSMGFAQYDPAKAEKSVKDLNFIIVD